jgi:hypothetical protein
VRKCRDEGTRGSISIGVDVPNRAKLPEKIEKILWSDVVAVRYMSVIVSRGFRVLFGWTIVVPQVLYEQSSIESTLAQANEKAQARRPGKHERSRQARRVASVI